MDYDSLPMLLSPKDVRVALGLPSGQINQVYRLFKSKRFPSERIGCKHVIPKPRFLAWLGEQESTKDN
jgi:hypothetical protein